MVGEITHYEIPAKNPAKLSKFYANVLGWKFKDSGMTGMKYWIMSANSSAKIGLGGMYKKTEARQAPVNYAMVANIDNTLKKLKQSGGKVAMGKMPISGMGWSAVAIDPEGNPIGLFQTDKKAKGMEKK